MKKVVKWQPQNSPMVECELTRIIVQIEQNEFVLQNGTNTEFVQSPQDTDINIHL